MWWRVTHATTLNRRFSPREARAETAIKPESLQLVNELKESTLLRVPFFQFTLKSSNAAYCVTPS
jgi:hypothetical protein